MQSTAQHTMAQQFMPMASSVDIERSLGLMPGASWAVTRLLLMVATSVTLSDDGGCSSVTDRATEGQLDGEVVKAVVAQLSRSEAGQAAHVGRRLGRKAASPGPTWDARSSSLLAARATLRGALFTYDPPLLASK